MDTEHLNTALAELKHDLKDVRRALMGDASQPGLLELVRDHERRLTAIEQLGRSAAGTVADKLLTSLLAAAAGAGGWLAAHFTGTRP